MARKLLTGADLNGQRITNLADPSAATDAATRQYVDNALAGLSWKQPVRVATTASGTLATAYANGQTIDGVTLTTGMRILLKDQAAAAENGIYTVNASGAPTRATDADATAELQSAAVYVIAGTVNADRNYIQTANDVTPGTTAQTWVQYGTGGAYTGGNGIQVSGSTITAVPKPSGGLAVDSSGLYIDSSQLAALGLARKYAADVASGSTSATVTHNLNSADVQVTVTIKSTGEEVEVDVVHTSVNVVTLTFATAPTTGQYRVVVIG